MKKREREDAGNVTFDPELAFPGSPFVNSSSSKNSDTDSTVPLPKLGLRYEATENTNVAFVVQRGYRSGGNEFDPLTGATSEFDPEFTWNYEASIRSEFPDNRGTLAFNVFYTDWEDMQVSVTDPITDLGTTVNAGESHIVGGEIELNALFFDDRSLAWYASIGYAKTEFDDFTDDDEDFSGKAFAYAPELTAATGLTYLHQSGIFTNVDVRYTDESYADPENTIVLNSYIIVNLNVGYEDENWRVRGFVDNLFDEFYTYEESRPSTTGGGTLRRLRPGAPTTYGVTGELFW